VHVHVHVIKFKCYVIQIECLSNQQIECPFRMLDEYDVFLDEVTRKMTLDTLQEYALDRSQCSRQMIIVTPNSISSVKTSNEVRVQKLSAPLREAARGLHQSTLDF
jgi:hypothetical protein